MMLTSSEEVQTCLINLVKEMITATREANRALLPPPQTGTLCHPVPSRSAQCPGWSSGMSSTGLHLQTILKTNNSK